MRSCYFISLLLAASLLFSNCKSNVVDDIVVPLKTDTYLVSYALVRSMTATDVKALFSPAQSVYPDVADILPLVSLGAKVYVVTYNTTLGTKKLVTQREIYLLISLCNSV